MHQLSFSHFPYLLLLRLVLVHRLCLCPHLAPAQALDFLAHRLCLDPALVPDP